MYTFQKCLTQSKKKCNIVIIIPKYKDCPESLAKLVLRGEYSEYEEECL